jgi:hypothetical protein
VAEERRAGPQRSDTGSKQSHQQADAEEVRPTDYAGPDDATDDDAKSASVQA